MPSPLEFFCLPASNRQAIDNFLEDHLCLQCSTWRRGRPVSECCLKIEQCIFYMHNRAVISAKLLESNGQAHSFGSIQSVRSQGRLLTEQERRSSEDLVAGGMILDFKRSSIPVAGFIFSARKKSYILLQYMFLIAIHYSCYRYRQKWQCFLFALVDQDCVGGQSSDSRKIQPVPMLVEKETSQDLSAESFLRRPPMKIKRTCWLCNTTAASFWMTFVTPNPNEITLRKYHLQSI